MSQDKSSWNTPAKGNRWASGDGIKPANVDIDISFLGTTHRSVLPTVIHKVPHSPPPEGYLGAACLRPPLTHELINSG